MAGLQVLLVGLGPVHGAHEVGLAPLLSGEAVDAGHNEHVGLVGLVAALVDDVDTGLAVEDDPFGVGQHHPGGVLQGNGCDEQGVDVGLFEGVLGPGDALHAGDGHGGHVPAGRHPVDDHAVGVEGGLVADPGLPS